MSGEFSADSSERERKDAKTYLDFLADKNISETEVIDRYDTSSDKYEECMDVINYNGPRETVGTVSRLFPSNRQDVAILDVAAGTGLVAIELQRVGFVTMDGFDASAKMLEEARKKDLYGKYICGMLGNNRLNIDTDTYEAVTICGMSTEIMKCLPANAFEELIRVVKPGGYIVNTGFYSTFQNDNVPTEDFRRMQRVLETEGKWKLVEIRKFPGFINGKDGGCSVHKVC